MRGHGEITEKHKAKLREKGMLPPLPEPKPEPEPEPKAEKKSRRNR